MCRTIEEDMKQEVNGSHRSFWQQFSYLNQLRGVMLKISRQSSRLDTILKGFQFLILPEVIFP